MICNDCIHFEVCGITTVLKTVNKCPYKRTDKAKHGEWVNPEMGYEDCSVCGYCFAVYDEHGHYIERNFCPNCGADLRKR